MSQYEAGVAYLQVLPSTKGFAGRLKKELAGVQSDVVVPARVELDRRGLAALRDVARNLPAIVLDADSSPADREIAALRDRLLQLSDKQIGVDISGDAARAEIDGIRSALQRLGLESPDIQVRVDAGAAEASLAGVHREASALDGKRVNVQVDADTSGASASIDTLSGRLGILIRLLPLIAPAIGAGIAVLPALAAAGGGALGVLAGSLSGVGDALKGYTADQDAAGKSAAASAATQAANARAIRDAKAAIADARRNEARVAQQGSEQIEAAEARVESAVRAERRAQDDLTQARKEATRQLQALREQVSDYALDERGADLAVRQARARLEQVNKDSKSSALDREQALYDVRVAEERLSDVQRERSEKTADLAEADRKGVDGSNLVVAAQERLADAHRGAQDAQTQLVRAQRDAATAQQDAARSTAQAIQRLADIQAQQAESSAAAAAGSSKFADAMAKLSLPAQDLVRQLISMKPLLDQLKATAAGAFLPGLTQMLRDSVSLFPIVNAFVKDAGTIMGDTARQMGALFKSDAFQANFAATLQAALPILQAVGDSVVQLTDAWFRLGAQSGPVAAGFASFITSMSTGLAGLFDALGPSMGAFGVIWEQLGALLGGLLPPLGDVIGALAQALAPILAALVPVVVQLAEMFAGLFVPVMQAVSPLLATIASVVGQLVMQLLSALAPAIPPLVTAFQVLATALTPIVMLIGQVLGALIQALAPILPVIADLVLQVVQAFTPLLALIAPLVQAVLPPLITIIQAMVGVFTILAPIIGQVVTILVQMIVAALVPLIPMFGQLYQVLASALVPLLPIFAQLFLAVVQAVLPLLPPLLNLAAVLLPILIQVITALVPIILWLVGIFIQGLTWTINNIVAPALRFLGVVFQGLGDGIAWVWNHIIKPAWDAIIAGINWVKDGFKTNVDQIGRIWNGLRNLLAKPINFMIDTVWNNGIRKAWNLVAGLIGIPEIGPLARIPEFATGGIVPGYAPGKDRVPAVLSPGEGILRPEATRALGGRWLDQVNTAAMRGGIGGVQRYMALGGESPQQFAGGGIVAPRGGGLGSAQRFAKAQDGKPYLWGGVGPGGFDCTGFLSAVANSALGEALYHRRFATGSFSANRGAGGFLPGTKSAFVIGVNPSVNGGPGHAAGQVGGLNVESRGGDGVVTGPRARGPMDRLFPWHFYLPEVGGTFVGGDGSGIDFIKNQIRSFVTTATDPAIGALERAFPAPPEFNKVPAATARTIRGKALDFFLGKAAFDRGGVASGIGLMWKGTGLDERVLPPAETQAYPTLTRLAQQVEAGRLTVPDGMTSRQRANAMAGRGGAGSTTGDTFNITAREHHSEERIAAEVQRRRDFAARTR